MKKALSIFVLCLFLISGCAQQPVLGSSATTSVNSEVTSSSVTSTPVLKEGDYDYKIEAGSVTIVKYNGTAENITIPDMIVSLPVKVIGESAFQENNTIKNLVISNSIVTVEKYAFSKCFYLESVQFGNNLEVIKENSFYDCPNLKQVTVNKNLKVIGDESFYGCHDLANLNLPESVESIGGMAFSQTAIKEFVFPSKIKVISGGIFNETDLITATLPEKVESIDAAFGQTNLSVLFIPDSVKLIDDQAFLGCSNELVLLYDNNPLVPKFAEEHNILCFKRSEYNPVLTVELVNGKPLNDDQNQGISQEDYNLVKRQSNDDLNSFDYAVSNDYICFLEHEERTDEAIKTKLTKTATLLYQCGITDFDPANLKNANSDYLDKTATFAIYSRSKNGTEVDDKRGSSGVIFIDDRTFYFYYTIFFGVEPDFSKITGHSQQQKGTWFYQKEFPKVQTEVLSFSGDAEKMEYSLKLRFSPESGSSIEKTFTFKFTKQGTVGGDQYRITLTGIK